jgi:transposase
VQYKAKEAGIEVRKVNPSGRCSAFGFLDIETAKRPATSGADAGPSRFRCPSCDYEADSEYNAARNLATAGIEVAIARQLAESESTTLAL